jgi:hypothetical protein
MLALLVSLLTCWMSRRGFLNVEIDVAETPWLLIPSTRWWLVDVLAPLRPLRRVTVGIRIVSPPSFARSTRTELVLRFPPGIFLS